MVGALEGDPVDVLLIGGGASGLGVAVDAQTRGYRTLLLEKYDFAKGTSSRSTKLVHGGVRYLQQGNVSLVMEALQAGARDFIVKPLKPESVIATIKKTIEKAD